MSDSPPSTDDARVELVLEQWFDLQATGGSADLDSLCAEWPHLTERIRGMLARHDALLQPFEKPHDECQPLPIDQLGGFELKARIGSGGMGDVYLARETALDRTVALKVLRRELTEDPLRRLRFKREAQLTAALDHPNIVPVYGTGEDQGHVFLAMKLLPGSSLDRIAKTWAPQDIARIGAKIARALHAAHEVGIVHRDIKPGNIQVCGDEAWVLDFGLARGRVDMTLTTEGQAPGTLAYMAPEQLRGDGNALDPRCDVYSLAATLYQCIANRPPFDDATPEALVRHALLYDPAPLALDRADHDYGIIVSRALEKDPVRRFATALEFAEDLERFAAGDPIQSRPPSTLTRAVKLVKRHPVASGALAATLFVSLLLVPQLWRSAQQRASDWARQLASVASSLDTGLPVVALERLRELDANPNAVDDPRFEELRILTHATLARDALLDRIQLGTVYRQSALDNEFDSLEATLPEELRGEPSTQIGLVFLAHAKGDADATKSVLHKLDQSRACPRLVAAFRAVLGQRDPTVALSSSAVGSEPLLDHLFTATLLRMADAPTAAVDAELSAGLDINDRHPRAKLMIGIQHWIRRERTQARQALALQMDVRRPSVETHCIIAVVATLDQEYDKAEQHLKLADRDLERTQRPPNRWLQLAKIELATARGQLDAAEQLLAAARDEFGDDEWLLICEAQILTRRPEQEPATRRLLERAREASHVPWNRRRARSMLLQMDSFALASPPNEADGRELFQVAQRLANEAGSLHEGATAAEAWMVSADIARSMYYSAFDAGRSTAAEGWEVAFTSALTRVFKIDDAHPVATYEFAQHAYNLLERPCETTEEALVIGRVVSEAQRRASQLTRLAYQDGKAIPDVLTLATIATRLSAAMGDRDEATRLGAIATKLANDASASGEASEPALLAILDETRTMLDLKSWPAPPKRGYRAGN